MNAVFCVIFLCSAVVVTWVEPDAFMPALLDGATRSLTVGATLFAIYAVWGALTEVAERSGLNEGIAKLLTPVSKRFFGVKDGETAKAIAMNLSCNLLGLGGAATPFAVKAIGRLEADGNERAQKLLFIVNATSLQLLPTTVLTLRLQCGSRTPTDVVLPCLIATFFCTAVAVVLFWFWQRSKRVWRT